MDFWINIEDISFIRIWDDHRIQISSDLNKKSYEDGMLIGFKDKNERDAEFAKIKILMGIEDYTSRCC